MAKLIGVFINYILYLRSDFFLVIYLINNIFTFLTMLSGVKTMSLLCQHFRFPKKRQRPWGLNLFLWKWVLERQWKLWKKRTLPTFSLWYLCLIRSEHVENLNGVSFVVLVLESHCLKINYCTEMSSLCVVIKQD